MTDSRVRARRKGEQTASGLGRAADAKNRSIRIRGLPLSVQEGLLQQALEKYASVKRLEVFQETSEAVVELETAAVSTSDVARLTSCLKQTSGRRKVTPSARTDHFQR